MTIITIHTTDANPQITVTPDGPPPDTQAPSTPTGLVASAVTQTSLVLSWQPSADNTAVAGYHIRRNGSLISDANSTSITEAGLSPATTYNYTVAAFDAQGNVSPSSAVLSVTTAATVPPPNANTVTYTVQAHVHTITNPLISSGLGIQVNTPMQVILQLDLNATPNSGADLNQGAYYDNGMLSVHGQCGSYTWSQTRSGNLTVGTMAPGTVVPNACDWIMAMADRHNDPGGLTSNNQNFGLGPLWSSAFYLRDDTCKALSGFNNPHAAVPRTIPFRDGWSPEGLITKVNLIWNGGEIIAPIDSISWAYP